MTHDASIIVCDTSTIAHSASIVAYQTQQIVTPKCLYCIVAEAKNPVIEEAPLKLIPHHHHLSPVLHTSACT